MSLKPNCHIERVHPEYRYLAVFIFAVIVFWIVLRLVFFEGFHGSDDFQHVRYGYFWNRLPKDHCEARLMYNAILYASFKLFDFGEASAAVPGMIGSLLLLASGMWLAWHRWHSAVMLLITGVLLACLPSDVLTCTTASASKTLASGFLALAAAFLLCGRRRLSAGFAGLFFAFGITSHLSVIFFVPILIAVVAFFEKQRRENCAIALAVTGAAFAAIDLGIYGLWTGDPLYRFHLISSVHFESFEGDYNARFVLNESGLVDWIFFWRPVRDLLISKFFGICGAAAVVGGLVTWRRRSPLCRTLTIAALLAWVWMSYGTHRPTEYVAFPGTTAYWQPLGLLFVLILSELLLQVRRRAMMLTATMVFVISNIALLALSGPWGQSVDITRHLLAYAEAHPTESFITDDRTLIEMFVLNRFRLLPNLYATPNTAGPKKFVVVQSWSEHEPPTDPAYVLVNPLNDRNDDVTFRWVSQHCGERVFAGRTNYRLLTYLLPLSFRQAHEWTIRRPPARVCRLLPMGEDSLPLRENTST